MDVLDELRDLHRTLVVSERDRVAREAGLSRVSVCVEVISLSLTHQFFNQGDQSLQVLFDGDVERIFVLEIDGYCKRISRAYFVARRSSSQPFMMPPTSSIVNKRPGLASLPSGTKPPR